MEHSLAKLGITGKGAKMCSEIVFFGLFILVETTVSSLSSTSQAMPHSLQKGTKLVPASNLSNIHQCNPYLYHVFLLLFICIG